jgi:Ca2+-binding RTX toxin-like protein
VSLLLRGEAGNDTVRGEADNDTIMGADGSDRLFGDAGMDTIDGGTGTDSIDGGTAEDSIVGDAGTDTLSGGAGADTILGGNENDTVLGGDGGDRLFGEAGNDTIRGGNDGDSIDGGTGADQMFGDAGVDTIVFSDMDGDSVDGGTAVDRILLNDSTLDFDNVADAQITAVEILDLDAGGVARSVTLDTADVLDFEATTGVTVDHDNNVGTAERTVNLVIQGDVSDAVTLDGAGAAPDWTAGATGVALAGYAGTYDIYYTSTAVVAIDTDITSVTISN